MYCTSQSVSKLTNNIGNNNKLVSEVPIKHKHVNHKCQQHTLREHLCPIQSIHIYCKSLQVIHNYCKPSKMKPAILYFFSNLNFTQYQFKINQCHPVIFLLFFLLTPFQGGVFGDHFVIYVSFLSLLCCLVCSLQPCDQLLGRADLLALLCVMFSLSLCFGVSG